MSTPAPVIDKHHDVDYDPEANGWVSVDILGHSIEKTVRGHSYGIYMDHHSFFVARDGVIVWRAGDKVQGNYRATDAALAWEIDHGIGPGKETP